jgi:hypothetical protein
MKNESVMKTVWARVRKPSAATLAKLNNNNEARSVRFLQHGVKDAAGKFYPCWYSHTTLIDGKVAVTLYAKSILTGLPAELRPINNSDMMTDYFENDHVRFFEGSAEYEQLVQLIAEKQRKDEARVARRMAKISHSAVDCFNAEGRPQ